MIKGIAFDKDGTLMDYDSFWVPVAEGAIKALLDPHHKESLKDTLNAIGAYDGIKGVLCHGTYTNIADAINKAIGTQFSADEVAEKFADSVGLAKVLPTCENIRPLFERLRGAGYILSVITSDNDSLTRYCLGELGIPDMFDRIYADDGIHPSKPAPYHMQRFLEEWGLEPSEVIMVGDTMTDMKFAENSGVRGVGVGKYATELLADKAGYIIPDISHIFSVLEKCSKGENT